MERSERGRKHLCPDCECKYYDLNKKTVTCPKCGAKPAPQKLPRSGRPVRASRGVAFRS
ncbi:FYDLN acid domain-containing protein [Pelagibius marinus]|uniref:FYDLN acid domain-containing protein n=1 Tax=Pelagibius marinus TaxID=2762760 RepID=UPI00187246E6